MLLDTILSKLRLRRPRSLLQPPLTIADMSHIISQSLPHFRTVHVFPYVPQRRLCVDFATLCCERYVCTTQLERTRNTAMFGFQGSDEKGQGLGVFLQQFH